jgi:hypothetical protein
MCPGLKEFCLPSSGTETHAESSIISVTKTWHAVKTTSTNQTFIFSEMTGKNLFCNVVPCFVSHGS